MATRPPAPPFSHDTATEKVRLAEDAWNSRDPETVAQGYTPDCHWRNRAEIVGGREPIIATISPSRTRSANTTGRLGVGRTTIQD